MHPQRSALPERFDERYYRVGYPSPYGRTQPWLAAFARIADEIVRRVAPRTCLDVGCAHGMLVEALVDRGVDARGVDVSAFALSQARADIRSRLRSGNAEDDLGGPYDLVTCIEVLEHLEPDSADAAITRLCAAADVILFSSSPIDFADPTHVNVQRPSSWLDAFARRGFGPDLAWEAAVVAPQAIVFRRGLPSDADRLSLVARRVELACAARFETDRAVALEEQLERTVVELAELRVQLRTALGEVRRQGDLLIDIIAAERRSTDAAIAVYEETAAVIESSAFARAGRLVRRVAARMRKLRLR